MGLRFEGVAHPPPPSGARTADADLTTGEIEAGNLGLPTMQHSGSTPINQEHEGPWVGRVLASCPSRRGGLLVEGTITDEAVANKVRSGEMLGLSLGTAVRSVGGVCVGRSIDHLAVCERPRRAGCYINKIDGKPAPVRMDLASEQSMRAGTPAPRSKIRTFEHSNIGTFR